MNTDRIKRILQVLLPALVALTVAAPRLFG
jgi:hypothetical protein